MEAPPRVTVGTQSLPKALCENSPTLRAFLAEDWHVALPDFVRDDANLLTAVLSGETTAAQWVVKRPDWGAACEDVVTAAHFLQVCGASGTYKLDFSRSFAGALAAIIAASLLFQRFGVISMTIVMEPRHLRDLQAEIVEVNQHLHVCGGRVKNIWYPEPTIGMTYQQVYGENIAVRFSGARIVLDTSHWVSARELTFHATIAPEFYARVRLTEDGLSQLRAGRVVTVSDSKLSREAREGFAPQLGAGYCSSSYRGTVAVLSPSGRGGRVTVRLDAESALEFWAGGDVLL